MKDLIIGYARVSTSEQDLTLQVEALEQAGCTKIFKEKVTGTSTAKRTELKRALDVLTTLKGGTLIITRVDRLCRSMKDLQDIVHLLKENNVALKATEQPIDTSTPAGKAFFDMLGVFAEFETNLRKERQLEGIQKAKADGRYKGRKPTAKMKTKEVLKMLNDGVPKLEIAERLNIGIASVYRIIKDEKQPTDNLNHAQSIVKELYKDNEIPLINGKPVKYLYRDSSGTLNSWHGKGRKPKWLNDYVANDGKVENIKIR